MFSKFIARSLPASASRSFAKKAPAAQSARCASSLRDVLEAQLPEKREAWKALKADYGDKKLGDVTVTQALGGARGVKCMVWETSLLDSEEGIRFRGHTIPDLQKTLPTFSGNQEDEPLPEGLLWLLLTSQ